jgi:hypothetical protein
MMVKRCKVCGRELELNMFKGSSVICWECEFELDSFKIRTNGNRKRLFITG